MDRDDVYMTPNMTYKPRVMKKEKGYFSTEEYREFYKIARNKQTRSFC